MTKYWLGVVSREHVHRGVDLGIAQANHGKRPPIARMKPGDGLVYYSPRTGIRDGETVKSFTAIGTIDDVEPWQVEERGFQPWRRSVTYRKNAAETPIDNLRDRLELTSRPNWGVVLRRGLLELSAHDFQIVSEAMGGS